MCIRDRLRKAEAAKAYTDSAAAKDSAAHNKDSVRAEIVAYCEEHAPEKLAQVDNMMQQFAGRESELLGFMRAAKQQKEGAATGSSSTELQDKRAEAASGATTVAPDDGKPEDEEKGQASEPEETKGGGHEADTKEERKAPGISWDEQKSEHKGKKEEGNNAENEDDSVAEQKLSLIHISEPTRPY